MVEMGVGTSFKAFKVLRAPIGETGGLRHVIEPYAGYLFVPEPNLEPAELLSFDRVDSLDYKHTVNVGVRNKLQRRTSSGAADLVDLNIYSAGNLDPDAAGELFQLVNMDAELRLASRVSVDIDAVLGLDGDTLRELNTHLMLGKRGATYANIEHRYRPEISSMIYGSLAYRQSERWLHSYSARYEIEHSRLQEHSLSARRNYDCMQLTIGFNHIPAYTTSGDVHKEDEYRIILGLWIKAFQAIGVSVK